MRTVHFLNLTNGLEWADAIETYSFIRVESTAIEKNDGPRILRDLDANFLMELASGSDCHFYDCGTRRETSKTVSVGVPFILGVLTDLWIGSEPFVARTSEARAVKRKLQYFGRYLNASALRLTGHSRSTQRDGDKPFYRNLALSRKA